MGSGGGGWVRGGCGGGGKEGKGAHQMEGERLVERNGRVFNFELLFILLSLFWMGCLIWHAFSNDCGNHFSLSSLIITSDVHHHQCFGRTSILCTKCNHIRVYSSHLQYCSDVPLLA